MKANLSKIMYQKTLLSRMISGSAVLGAGDLKKLKELVLLLEEVETDLELGGESIIELDKARLDAIKERDKLKYFMQEDDQGF